MNGFDSLPIIFSQLYNIALNIMIELTLKATFNYFDI